MLHCLITDTLSSDSDKSLKSTQAKAENELKLLWDKRSSDSTSKNNHMINCCFKVTQTLFMLKSMASFQQICTQS